MRQRGDEREEERHVENKQMNLTKEGKKKGIEGKEAEEDVSKDGRENDNFE